MVNECFLRAPRFLLIDEIEDMKQSDQATLLSLLQDGVLVETKVSKTRRIEFTCSVIATCNSVEKLKERLLSRFAVIELKAYDSLEEFKQVTLDVLKKHPLSEYVAEQVWLSSDKPNIRDCVRIASLCKTEQDVLRVLRILRSHDMMIVRTCFKCNKSARILVVRPFRGFSFLSVVGSQPPMQGVSLPKS